MSVVWEDPPHWHPKTRELMSALEEVKANPGRWAKVRFYDSGGGARSAARNIRRGDFGAGFEATARVTEDNGAGWVYARYVGEEE